jgi:thioredoxin-like negative regulator of GroEL
MRRLSFDAPFLRAALLAGLSAAALLAWPATARAATATAGASVAWQAAAADADIERAFAQARAEKKPLLLYWGAAWCPPCNQLKATLFNRADFIERSKSFVAVSIDGDLPGAQKLGGRFKVRGYPTMILMAADGSEITRLPGEVDAPQVMAVLQLGLAGGRPVKALLADVLADKPLSGPEWRSLAFYAWDTDEAQLVPAAERAGLLAQLSLACPPAEAAAATRMLLKALAESDDGKGIKPDAALRARVQALLADPAVSRAQMDVVVNYAAEITRALAPEPGADRRRVAAAFDVALQRLQADASLSRADRLNALASRVALARIDQPQNALRPKLPTALLQRVREQVARDNREISDGYERQAVVTAGAGLLTEAGLWTESEALLKANLAKSHSPFYLMSQLGSNARKLGHSAEALGWFESAYQQSVGPATRLQWGASYLAALVDLAPQDAVRIERVARQLFAEAGKDPAAFHERSARSLQRVGSKLAAWNKTGQHDAALRRLNDGQDGQPGLAAVCGRLDAADAQRATCEAILKAAVGKI